MQYVLRCHVHLQNRSVQFLLVESVGEEEAAKRWIEAIERASRQQGSAERSSSPEKHQEHCV